MSGHEKLHLRGVTCGTFRARPDTGEWPTPEIVEADFASMAAAGINSVRTYVPPPRWLLDTAAERRLHVRVSSPFGGECGASENRA